MKVIKNELILLNLLVIALVLATIFLPTSSIRIVLGVPFLIFFPGYAALAGIFPARQSIDGIERIALSFGLSIAIVPLIALALNYTPWGIRLEPILYSVSLFIVTASIVAWLRRRRLPEPDRFTLEFRLSLPTLGQGTLNRVLMIAVALAVFGAVATTMYVIVRPGAEEQFTEFYILDSQGKAAEYPEEVRVGEEATLILGIVNHENGVVSYRVEIRFQGVTGDVVGPVVLGDEEEWQETVGFMPQEAGSRQKVEFVLYKEGEASPYLKPLTLWVDVTG